MSTDYPVGRYIIESFIPQEGGILDFGCGYGILANLMALRGRDRWVVGMDSNRRRVRIAEHSIKNRKNIEFRHGNISRLNEEQFNAVVMTDVLHHLNDKSAGVLLEKISACLIADGLLVILDIDRVPQWKFHLTHMIDRILNPLRPLFYRPAETIQFLLKEFPFTLIQSIRADQGLPLSDIIFIFKKDLLK